MHSRLSQKSLQATYSTGCKKSTIYGKSKANFLKMLTAVKVALSVLFEFLVKLCKILKVHKSKVDAIDFESADKLQKVS